MNVQGGKSAGLKPGIKWDWKTFFAWGLEVVHPVSTLGLSKSKSLQHFRKHPVACVQVPAVEVAPEHNIVSCLPCPTMRCCCRGCRVRLAHCAPVSSQSKVQAIARWQPRAGIVWICLIASLSLSLPQD